VSTGRFDVAIVEARSVYMSIIGDAATTLSIVTILYDAHTLASGNFQIVTRTTEILPGFFVLPTSPTGECPAR
jgi:hypothetical protein